MDKINKKIYPFVMLLPALIVFGVFYILPNISGFYFAMTDWNITRIDNIVFIGFDNFIRLFKEDFFITSIKNVFLFTIISGIIKNIVGFILALFLNRNFNGKYFFRTVFFLPCVLSALVVGYIFSFMMNPTIGIIDGFLTHIGLTGMAQDWLGNARIAMYSISAVDIWMWTGMCIVIYMAGLQAIPAELKESSKIDGANAFQTFRHVTLPLMVPSININIVLSIISGLKVFDLVYILTSGGPGFSTEVLSTVMYKATSTGKLGYGAAIGVVSFIIIAAITLPTLKVLRRNEVEL